MKSFSRRSRPVLIPLVPANRCDPDCDAYTLDCMHPPAEASSSWPAARFRIGFVWLAIVLAIGFLLFFYHYLGPLAEGRHVNPIEPLITEMTGAFSAGILFFAVVGFTRAFPLTAKHLMTRMPLYFAAAITFAILHTTMMWASRLMLFPMAGLGGYDYGKMPLRISWKLRCNFFPS